MQKIENFGAVEFTDINVSFDAQCTCLYVIRTCLLSYIILHHASDVTILAFYIPFRYHIRLMYMQK